MRTASISLLPERSPQRRFTRCPPSASFSVHAPPASDQAAPSPKSYTFSEIAQRVAAGAKNDSVLIDVREFAELEATGTIPRSLHLPMSSAQDAFFVSDEVFKSRFGFERPAKCTEVVFFCKSGFRSFIAAQQAITAGWEHVGNYGGSWTDWEKNGGEREIRGGR